MSRSARTVSARIRPPVDSGTLTWPAYVAVGIAEEGSVRICVQYALKRTERKRKSDAAFFWFSAGRIRSSSDCHSCRAANPSSMLASTSGCVFLQEEDGIRDDLVTGVQTCALPICL